MKDFLKAAGVKTEKDFYKKYPTEESFFKANPKMAKKYGFDGSLTDEPSMEKSGSTLRKMQDGGLTNKRHMNNISMLDRRMGSPTGALPQYGFGAFLGKASGWLGDNASNISTGGGFLGGRFGSILKDVGVGAGMGAAFGGVGALVGGGIGLLKGIFGGKKKKRPHDMLQQPQAQAALPGGTVARTTPFIPIQRQQGTTGITGQGYYAMGGDPSIAQYEVERGEVVQGGDVELENGKMIGPGLHLVTGRSHKSGGVKGRGGDRVFSKRLRSNYKPIGV